MTEKEKMRVDFCPMLKSECIEIQSRGSRTCKFCPPADNHAIMLMAEVEHKLRIEGFDEAKKANKVNMEYLEGMGKIFRMAGGAPMQRDQKQWWPDEINCSECKELIQITEEPTSYIVTCLNCGNDNVVKPLENNLRPDAIP